MTKKRRRSRRLKDETDPTVLSEGAVAASQVSRLLASPHACAAILVALQLLVAAIVLWRFMSGQAYFAFTDIGSDTYEHYVPIAMHLARELQQGIPGSWSFEFGLGGITRLGLNPFLLINAAWGPDAVPAMRIWVYLLKLVLGCICLYYYLVVTGRRPVTSAIVALSYSFCGFIVVDGQWDPLASEYALYPLILLAIALLFAERPRLWPLPLAIALAVLCGLFVFSIGVFLAYCFVAALITSPNRRATLAGWLIRAFPLAALGLALAAPQVIAHALQLLDSPRVTGTDAGFAMRLVESVRPNNSAIIHSQLAGLLHKDLLGIGNSYRGWTNYLEGPTFFVGVIPLLIIPQLWTGSKSDRRVLIATLAALAAFVALPALRYLAFGFALPYFRVTNLWVSLLLLIVAARALDLILSRRVRRVPLAVTVGMLSLLMLYVRIQAPGIVNGTHLAKIAVVTGVSAACLFLFSWVNAMARHAGLILLLLAAVTAAVFSYPAFNTRRAAVTASRFGFGDGTLAALGSLRDRDPGFFRVEKSFDSGSLCDALAQGYMGVKSYWFHSSSTVRIFSGLEVAPARQQRRLNPSNWLPNFADRFALYSLVGVKYFLSRRPVQWPGFGEIGSTAGMRIYENRAALPLGFVYTQQFRTGAFSELSVPLKDSAVLRAAILDTPVTGVPDLAKSDLVPLGDSGNLEETYFGPLRELTARGLDIEVFTDQYIVGTISTEAAGILTLSIPYSSGWSISINDERVRPMIVNFGMLGAQIGPGRHRIEATYVTPGQTLGLALSAVAALGILVLSIKRPTLLGPGSPLSQASQ